MSAIFFIFFLRFLQISVKMLLNLTLFTQNVDFFKQFA